LTDTPTPDLWRMYKLMLKSRLFEEAITRLWQDGRISGEMHLGTGGRRTVQYDNIPAAGRRGPVPACWAPLPISKAALRRQGEDVTLVSLGVGVHRALQASGILHKEGISASVLDLRTVAPLDREALCQAVSPTGRMGVVDEDYEGFGLSGEIAALLLEAGISFRYARACTQTTIPYARRLEDQVLPNVERICAAARGLM
jgi:pyruvate/2-oxoglutarate/acetoin dehydrogenase E1 component